MRINGVVCGAYVVAVRDDVACLIDIRANDRATWFDVALDDIEDWAGTVGALGVKGPVGAYAFITDGVVTESTIAVDSIHIAQPPPEIVDSFLRRGYVPIVSGHINARIGGNGPTPPERRSTGEDVTVGTWTSMYRIIRRMISVVDASFRTLPWHTGPGASSLDLMRTYLPVALPEGIIMAQYDGEPVGGVIVHRDVRTVPPYVLRLPIWMQRPWLFLAARTTPHIHVSVAGVLPHMRRTKVGLAVYEEFVSLMSRMGDVTTSWIDDRNEQSSRLTVHAGLTPCQHRQVFYRNISLESTHHSGGSL